MSGGFTALRDVEYRPAADGLRPAAFDLFVPEQRALPGAFVFLHGGGWRFGDKAASERIPVALTRAGVAVVNANYALTTERPYPQNVDDVLALIAHLEAHADELGIDSAAPILGIGGASAGGHLASLAVTKGLAEDRLATRPAAVVSWYAPLDPASRFLAHRYPPTQRPGGFWDRGGAEPPSPRDPFVPFIGTEDFGAVTLDEALDGDPRRHLARLDPSDLPPFLLLTGSDDSAEIRYAQRTWHGALRSVGAESTLIEIADADHEDPQFSAPALIGAVVGHLRDALATTPVPALSGL